MVSTRFFLFKKCQKQEIKGIVQVPGLFGFHSYIYLYIYIYIMLSIWTIDVTRWADLKGRQGHFCYPFAT